MSRLYRFPHQKTLCGATIHPWTPLRVTHTECGGDKRSPTIFVCPEGNRLKIHMSEVVPFPKVITLTERHGSHDPCTTFDVVLDHAQHRPGFIAGRRPANGDIEFIPLDVVDHAECHIPPDNPVAV